MDRIISYKLWSSLLESNVKKYLEDIFQELVDKGFDITITRSYTYIGSTIYEVIIEDIRQNGKVMFRYDTVSDYVDSSIDYMKGIDYKFSENNSAIREYDTDFNFKIKQVRGDSELVRVSIVFIEISSEVRLP